MNDGTAINASDPSSMKDQGITRNAMYHVEICDYDVRHSSSGSSLYKAFLTRDNAKNHGQYSFGGRSQMRSVLPKHELHNDFLESTASSVPKEDYYVYRKDQLQRVSDYTKNISQSIFSPGLNGQRQTLNKSVDKPLKYKTIGLKNQRAMSCTSYKSNRKLQDIEKMLSEEHAKRKKLESDIEEVRSNLSRFRDLVK